MRHLRLALLALGLTTATALSACTSGSTYTVSDRRCDITKHQVLVGKNWGEVRLPPSLNVRLIESGEVVSQDYSPSRLNLFVDAKGWIARVTCG